MEPDGIILSALVTAIVCAFALPLATYFLRIWAFLYTWGLPEDIRRRRRAELESDLHEHRISMRAQGYRPVEIACQVLIRCVRGVPADVAWSLQERFRACTLNMAKVVARAVDLKDPYTSGHSERVAELAGRLALFLRASSSEAVRIGLAGLLHDVGKVRVRAELIRKASRLTEPEVSVLKSHVHAGAAIARLFDPLGRLSRLVRHHHENWDGSGYPDRLKAADIPFGSRVIFVADAFNALTTHRPYRRGRTPYEAVTILKAHAGVMFDPAVVRALEKVMKVPRQIPEED